MEKLKRAKFSVLLYSRTWKNCLSLVLLSSRVPLLRLTFEQGTDTVRKAAPWYFGFLESPASHVKCNLPIDSCHTRKRALEMHGL